MTGTLERLAKRCADEQYVKIQGVTYERYPDMFVASARWWLNALAEEAEADADSHMDAYYAGSKARHAALWLREQNNQAADTPLAVTER